ncbi:hypothetical protein [Candidatus Kuenenia stuttgartensis]
MSLQRGDFDIALNGIEITPERTSTPYYSHVHIFVFSEQIVVRAL